MFGDFIIVFVCVCVRSFLKYNLTCQIVLFFYQFDISKHTSLPGEMMFGSLLNMCGPFPCRSHTAPQKNHPAKAGGLIDAASFTR